MPSIHLETPWSLPIQSEDRTGTHTPSRGEANNTKSMQPEQEAKEGAIQAPANGSDRMMVDTDEKKNKTFTTEDEEGSTRML